MSTEIQVATVNKASLKPQAKSTLTDWALMRAVARPLPVVRDPDIDPLVRQQLAVMVSYALGRPLREFDVIERVGRIVTVSVVPATHNPDPEIPLALVPLGRRYDRALRAYVHRLVEQRPWEMAGYGVVGDPACWWRKAKRACDKVLRALDRVGGLLNSSELAYLVLRLQVPLAWPEGVPRDG